MRIHISNPGICGLRNGDTLDVITLSMTATMGMRLRRRIHDEDWKHNVFAVFGHGEGAVKQVRTIGELAEAVQKHFGHRLTNEQLARLAWYYGDDLRPGGEGDRP